MAATPTFTQQALTGLLTPIADNVTGDDGVLAPQGSTAGKVVPTGTPSMNVQVNPAIFSIQGPSYTSLGPYLWTFGTTAYTAAVQPADPTNPRIDMVTAQITAAGTSTTPGQADIVIVPGTPAVTPAAPTQPPGSLLLATYTVAANANTITAGNITDQRVFTSLRTTGSLGSVVTPATVTSTQGSITGLVDLTGATVTWTATAGRRYEIQASGFGCSSTVAGDVYQVNLILNGSTVGQDRGSCDLAATQTNSWHLLGESNTLSGTVTAKITIQRAIGTGTLSHGAGTANPTKVIVKDIGV